jgi:2,3-bisphosphoglycerate-dependent phosphoglycerate mutase
VKKIYLVRHEESEANANVNAVTTTVATIPLTANGKNNAKIFADTCDVVADLVIVSPYLRTQQTAEPYIDKNAITHVEMWNTEEFTYLHQAKYNGTTTLERREAAHAYWSRADIQYKDGNDCESFAEFVDRVLVVRNQLLARTENTILLFSHGYFIRTFLYCNDLIVKGQAISDRVKLDCMVTISPRPENFYSKIKSSTLYPVTVTN